MTSLHASFLHENRIIIDTSEMCVLLKAWKLTVIVRIDGYDADISFLLFLHVPIASEPG